MSKSLAQMARILSAANEELFDRFVDVRLTREYPSELREAEDFQIRTPKTGLKPNITVSGQIILAQSVCLVTLTIGNISEQIDTMAYNWAEIKVGYLNSGIYTTFVGQITNCYMAKPNPNGELVVSVTTAPITDLYAHGDFEVAFTSDTVDTQTLILTCVNKMCSEYPELRQHCTDVVTSMAVDWKSQTFTVGKATRHFRSPLSCIAWLNSLFASFTYNSGFTSVGAESAGGFSGVKISEGKDLPPLRLGFGPTGDLRCVSSYSQGTPTALKALHAIGSAFKKSTDSATVTAPFNPEIFPGDLIYIDAKYFKTRINIDSVRDRYKATGNLWLVNSMQFTFSTMTTNTMTMELVNEQLRISGSEG